MRHIHTFAATLAAMLCLIMAACHSSRHTSVPSAQEGWHTLEVPVKIIVEKPMGMTLSGRATLVRDSSVYVSMRMLGMEVAFATATADSVMLCDRYHKMYLSEPLDALLPAKYADVGELQRIMLGCGVPAQLQQHLTMSDPAETPLGLVHGQIGIATAVGKTQVRATLIYQFDKAEWNGATRALPQAPKGATRINATQLLKQMQP